MYKEGSKFSTEQRRQADGEYSTIERPRSALHSGDFGSEKIPGSESSSFLSTSPPAPWTSLFPHAIRASHIDINKRTSPLSSERLHLSARGTASCEITLPQSFSLRPPTSPLVYQANSGDTEMSRFAQPNQSAGIADRSIRRHTFSPRSFQTYHASPLSTPDRRPGLCRSLGIPYQAHQPRRSVSSISTNLIPQSPSIRSRRPSCASDTSQLHHAPMVGSFEESILRGRMSTNPSRPLNFIAQIGVLGKGKCPSALRCPPHVTIPFPAVFYSYGSGSGRIPGNLPSPYVGLVDIENSLSAAEDLSEIKRKRRDVRRSVDHSELPGAAFTEYENLRDGSRKREKMKRRLTASVAPPGGCYRIPQHGQIQIVIKNPNKTAVKLFLVPYNLSDMQPGQKTFIRQRSYSAGPIIDMPLSSRGNLGTDRPEASLSTSDEPTERPVLRYLVHLHICCPAKGRFYLYKSIRVVFANRVLDGKEKLRNEIQLPEPRYSSYKPLRDVQQQATTACGPSSSLAIVRTLSRCSEGRFYDQGLDNEQEAMYSEAAYSPFASPSPRHPFASPNSRVQSIPLNLPKLPTLESRPASRDCMETDSSPRSQSQEKFRPLSEADQVNDDRFVPCCPSSSWTTVADGEDQNCDELSRARICNGMSRASSGPGLLTSQLKDLDFRKEKIDNDLPKQENKVTRR